MKFLNLYNINPGSLNAALLNYTKMNLDNLEILANSIKIKNKIVTPKNLMLESLFFNFGTLNEYDASELLFKKREQIEKKLIKKYGKLNSDVICPVSICYNKWAGNKSILDNY